MCNMTSPSETKSLILETVGCSRCGGSGQYSYCATMKGKYGPFTCFKCLGAGRVYTKRGGAASDLLTAALSRPAASLKPGDTVRHHGAWLVVVEAYQQDETRWTAKSIRPDGTFGYWFCVVMRDKSGRTCSVCGNPEDKFRVAHSEAAKAPIRALVAEYQELLTKTGKHPKTKAKAARVAEIMRELGLESN